PQAFLLVNRCRYVLVDRRPDSCYALACCSAASTFPVGAALPAVAALSSPQRTRERFFNSRVFNALRTLASLFRSQTQPQLLPSQSFAHSFAKTPGVASRAISHISSCTLTSQLTPLESALTRSVPLSAVESALTESALVTSSESALTKKRGGCPYQDGIRSR